MASEYFAVAQVIDERARVIPHQLERRDPGVWSAIVREGCGVDTGRSARAVSLRWAGHRCSGRAARRTGLAAADESLPDNGERDGIGGGSGRIRAIGAHPQVAALGIAAPPCVDLLACRLHDVDSWQGCVNDEGPRVRHGTAPALAECPAPRRCVICLPQPSAGPVRAACSRRSMESSRCRSLLLLEGFGFHGGEAGVVVGDLVEVGQGDLGRQQEVVVGDVCIRVDSPVSELGPHPL